MGVEDDLAGMFKHFNLGGKGVSGIFETLMRNMEISALRQIRKQIDDQIEKLSGVKIGENAKAELDPYEILGVKCSATRPEIDKAYKKRVWETHPDRGGTNNAFIRVQAAYEAIRRIRGWRS